MECHKYKHMAQSFALERKRFQRKAKPKHETQPNKQKDDGDTCDSGTRL